MNNKLPFTIDEFKDIYSKAVRLTVEVCILGDRGIVLSKRQIEPCIGQWHIPGGTVYFGETPEEAVLRVAKAECGVEVRVEELVGTIVYPEVHAAGYFGWPIGLAYRVSIVAGDLQGSTQAEEVQFFSKIPESTLHEQAIFLRDKLDLKYH